MTNVNTVYCRSLLKLVLADVKKALPKEEYKVLKVNSWAYKYGRKGTAEFQINKNPYLLKGFYWSGQACNLSEAKAKGWQSFMTQREELMEKLTIKVSNPTHNLNEEKMKLTKEDVWGKWNHEEGICISKGMIVAQSEQRCPIFKDKIPYKSVTVVCSTEQQDEVEYWLEYVHGGGSISKRKELPGSKVAIRSNYMCW